MTGNYTLVLMCLISVSLLESLINSDGTKPYMYLQEFPYDGQDLVNYMITQLINAVAGFTCVTLIVAEGEFVSHPLIYLEARYLELHGKLENLLKHSTIESKKLQKSLSAIFKDSIKDIIRRHQEIDDFSIHANDFIGLKVFKSFIFGTMSLCCIAFQLAMVS